jgi:hypothetical protein
LNRADAELIEIQNMHIKRQGVKESHLTDPVNIRNLSMTKYSQNLKATMAIEILPKAYPFYNYYLKRANTSGTLKLCCGDNTRLIASPINASQNEEKSVAWMTKMRAHAGYLHKSKTHTFKGITDPDERSTWNGKMRKRRTPPGRIRLSLSKKSFNMSKTKEEIRSSAQ